MHTLSFLLSLIPKVRKWKQKGIEVVLQSMASMFSLYDHIILQANASSLAFHRSILLCFQSPKYYSFSTGELRQENLCSFEARKVYIENLVSKTYKTNKRCRKLPETHWQGCSLPRHCLSLIAWEDHPSKHLMDLSLF